MARKFQPHARDRAREDTTGLNRASPSLARANHPSTLIIPLTTKLVEDAEPLRLRMAANGQLWHDFDLLIDQLRAIDNRRLVQGPLIRLPASLMHRVDDAVKEVLDVD